MAAATVDRPEPTKLATEMVMAPSMETATAPTEKPTDVTLTTFNKCAFLENLVSFYISSNHYSSSLESNSRKI